MPETFEDKIKAYQEKSPDHLQYWKKIWALVNFANTVEDFDEWEGLEFAIRCFMKGFLKPGRQHLLDEMIQERNIDYTKWAVKDGWVKMQMINGYRCHPGSEQLELPFFDLDKKLIESRDKSPLWSKIVRYKLYT